MLNTRRDVMKKRNWILGAATAALPLMFMLATSNAEARPPRSGSATVTRTGPAGNSSVRQSNLSTTGQGGYSASSSYTGRAGNTATRQQSGAYNPATKTFSRSGGTTGPAGNQSSFNTSVQATGNGYQRNAVHTGPNGNRVTSQGQASYNPATGTINQSRTTTGPNGKSATESRTIQTAPAPSGN
jgi:hypothetical protein